MVTPQRTAEAFCNTSDAVWGHRIPLVPCPRLQQGTGAPQTQERQVLQGEGCHRAPPAPHVRCQTPPHIPTQCNGTLAAVGGPGWARWAQQEVLLGHVSFNGVPSPALWCSSIWSQYIAGKHLLTSEPSKALAATGGVWPHAVRNTLLQPFGSTCQDNRYTKPGTTCNQAQSSATKSTWKGALPPFLKQALTIKTIQVTDLPFFLKPRHGTHTEHSQCFTGRMQESTWALFWVRIKGDVKKHWRHEWKKLNRSRSRDVSLRKWQGTQEKIREVVQINKHTEMRVLWTKAYSRAPVHSPLSVWEPLEGFRGGVDPFRNYTYGHHCIAPASLFSFVAFCRLCSSGLQASAHSPCVCRPLAGKNPTCVIKNEKKQNGKRENKSYKRAWLSTPFVPWSVWRRANREGTEAVLV